MSSEALVVTSGSWRQRCIADGRNYATWEVKTIVDFAHQPLVLVCGPRDSGKTTLVANNLVAELWPHTSALLVYSHSEEGLAQWNTLLTAQGIASSDTQQVAVHEVRSTNTVCTAIATLMETQQRAIANAGGIRDSRNMIVIVLDDTLDQMLYISPEIERLVMHGKWLNILTIGASQSPNNVSRAICRQAEWVAYAQASHQGKAVRMQMKNCGFTAEETAMRTAGLTVIARGHRFGVFARGRHLGMLTIESSLRAETSIVRDRAHVRQAQLAEAPLWYTVLDGVLPIRDLCDIVVAYIAPLQNSKHYIPLTQSPHPPPSMGLNEKPQTSTETEEHRGSRRHQQAQHRSSLPTTSTHPEPSQSACVCAVTDSNRPLARSVGVLQP